MDLIESINFLDQHWDECIDDKSISCAIENNSNILSLQEHFLNSISQEFQQNQYSQLETLISDLNNTISSISTTTKDTINLLIKSQNQISTITHMEDHSEFTKIKRNIQEAKKFYEMLNEFNKGQFPRYKKGNDYNNFKMLDKLIEFRDMFNKEIIELFKKERKNLAGFIENTLDSIEEDIKKAFFNRKLSNNQTLELYRKYYSYIKELTLPNKDKLDIFRESCIKSAVEGILKNINPSFLSEMKDIINNSHNLTEIASNISSKIKEKISRPTFNYEDERIEEICKLVYLTPTSIPQIDYKNDPLELRVVYFIVNLPQIIEKSIYELSQIFEKKPISKKFLEYLVESYKKLLDPKNIRLDYEQNEAMFWCFLFSFSSIHQITFNSSSLYKSKIIEIINITKEVSLKQANLLYTNFIDKDYSDTNKSKSKKLSKIYSLSWDEQKYIQSKNKQQFLDDYIRSFMTIMKEEVVPVSQCISIFYDLKSKNRANFSSTWYDQMIDTQKDCGWFTDYILKVQVQFFEKNINFILGKFDEKNIFFMFCMLNYYTKCLERLYNSFRTKFSSFFSKKIKFNESQNIRQEKILDIIITYKKSDDLLSANNADKFLNLYAKESALYIHDKCKMILETVKSFIKYHNKKEQDLNLLVQDIFSQFKDYLIEQLSVFPIKILRQKGMPESDIPIQKEIESDIRQFYENVK